MGRAGDFFGGAGAVYVQIVEDVVGGGGRGLTCADGEAGLGESGGGEPDAFGRVMRWVKVNLGGEGLMGDVAGLDGLEFDEGGVPAAVNHEEKVYSAAEVGAAAVDAGLVGVVDEDDGGVQLVGEGAEGAEDGDEGEDGVFVGTWDDASKGVDYDEGGGVPTGVGGDSVDAVGVAEVKPGEGSGVEGEVVGGVVGAHGTGKALEEAVAAALFVDPEDVGLVGGVIEPRLSQGEGDGEVEDDEGLFGTGTPGDEGEAGVGDEVVDKPAGLDGVGEGVGGGHDCEGFGGPI